MREYAISSAGLIEIIRAVTGKQDSLRLQVEGFSMAPFIRNNDVVTISPLSDNHHIAFGLPVAFIHPGNNKIAIHRVVGKCGSHYIIKGDSLPKIDGEVAPKDILGYVASVERGGRNIFLGLGPERRIVACLSRIGILMLLTRSLRILIRPLKRAFL